MASTMGTTEVTPLAPVAPAKTTKVRERRGTYPYWFYLPAAIIFTIFFLVPTIVSLYFSFTRWDLFTSTWIGLDNYVLFFNEQALIIGLRNTLIYATMTSGLKVVLGMLLALLLTSKIIARGYLRSVIFFPVLVSTVGVGLTFGVLMNPTTGLINNALATVGVTGPDWLTNPSLAIFSIALVDVWAGVGLATVIFIAGIVSIPSDYFEAAQVDGASSVLLVLTYHPAACPPGDRDRGHPFADRRVEVVRPDLDHDRRWSRLCLRHHCFGDLQAVPGRLLWPVDGRKRGAVPAGERHHRAPDLVAEPTRG